MSEEINDKRKDIEEYLKRISTLPDLVYATIMGEYGTNMNAEITDKFKLDDDQRSDMLDLILSITLKDVPLESIVAEIMRRLAADEETARQISLEILCKEFYAAKDFFPGVEDMITKLGGEIPKLNITFSQQLMKRDEQIEEMELAKEEEERRRMEDIMISKPIKELMSQFPEIAEQVIGSQQSIMAGKNQSPMKPMIKYWIEDYREKTGYYSHSNLDRVQYVYHDKNTKNMNEEERRQLGLVLRSIDDEISLPYSTKLKKIDFSKTIDE